MDRSPVKAYALCLGLAILAVAGVRAMEVRGAGPGEIAPRVLASPMGAPRAVPAAEGPVVLSFWATWCEACKVAIPEVRGLREALRGPGFGAGGIPLYGVAIESGSAEALRAAATRLGIDYPLLMGDQAVAEAFGVRTLPTTLVVDVDGRILLRRVGPVTEGEIRAVLGYRVALGISP